MSHLRSHDQRGFLNTICQAFAPALHAVAATYTQSGLFARQLAPCDRIRPITFKLGDLRGLPNFLPFAQDISQARTYTLDGQTALKFSHRAKQCKHHFAGVSSGIDLFRKRHNFDPKCAKILQRPQKV
jgi:hypothetical protein